MGVVSSDINITKHYHTALSSAVSIFCPVLGFSSLTFLHHFLPPTGGIAAPQLQLSGGSGEQVWKWTMLFPQPSPRCIVAN